MCQRLFSVKVAGRVFCEFCEVSKNSFFHRTHLVDDFVKKKLYLKFREISKKKSYRKSFLFKHKVAGHKPLTSKLISYEKFLYF